MIVKGKLASWTAGGKRAERRRIVNLAARLNERETTAIDVKAVDISPVGCMVTPAGAARVGDTVWLKLSGVEALRCRVIWVDQDEAGCWFERRLHPTDLAALLEQARKNIITRPGPFGRKTRTGSRAA